jgi:uncharacterized protein Usg
MNTQGQIHNGSYFSTEIKKVIKTYKPHNIVEIGTWKGMGSTLRIIEAIQDANYDNPPNFISLETNLEFYTQAKSNLTSYLNVVSLIHGKIITAEKFEQFNEHFPVNDLWYQNDLNNYKTCPSVLDHIPKEIDFLLLDGGEYSTYLEWLLLKDRTKIVALDDTKMVKTKRIAEECFSDYDNYKLICSSSERHGFHIFLNKSIV